MRKICITVLFASLLLLQLFAVSALDADDARQDWRNAKTASMAAQEEHRHAKIEFADDRSEDNRQRVVDTGKEALHAALDEAEAWLVWKKIEAQENPDVPDDVMESIENDVDRNIGVIDELRMDVDGIENQLQLGLVWLKMIGKYFELLTDVARNSGQMWVHIADLRADKVAEYEQKLRDAADGDEDVIYHLDLAQDELDDARDNIDRASEAYEQVRRPGTPLIKFAEGNNYLTIARGNLVAAVVHLDHAYRELVR